jgi:excisionase family DNA binding protein
MKPEVFTVKEFAARERVHERTVRRWVEKGAVEVRRTPGGSIRITDPHHDNHRASTDNRGHSSR